MNTFSAKSIGLYLLAIGGSIGFFCLVTNYGEANIKARKDLSGTYLITTPNLPNCLDLKQISLNLQQSGIFLNASLIDRSVVKATISERQLTLSGKLTDRQPPLSLSGNLPVTLCPQPSKMQITASVGQIPTSVTQSSNQLATQSLQGRIWLVPIDSQVQSTAPGTEFTAILQPRDRDPTASKSSH